MAIVLILVLVFSTLGLGLLQLSASNAIDTSKTVDRARAFWAAEAGLQEAAAQATFLRNTGQYGQYCFPASQAWTNTIGALSYQVAVTNLGTFPPSFSLTSYCQSPGGARHQMQVDLQQTNALPMGLFAVDRLDMPANVHILSHDDSSPGLRIGANGRIVLPSQSGQLHLEGTLARGTDPYTGEQARLDCDPDCVVDGFDVIDAGDIDPDPLGIFHPGPLAHKFTTAATWFSEVVYTNSPPLVSGDYYYWDMTVQSNATLIVDVSGGIPVNVFLKGSFHAQEGSRIEVNGLPSDFRIFANSTNTISDRIEIDAETDLSLFIYAPGLDVSVKSGGDFSGGVWARNVDIEVGPSGRILIDRQLLTYHAFSPWHVYRLVYANWAASSK